MIKQWELFEKISTGRTARVMRISLNERGGFAFNQRSFEELGQPEFVELYFDKINGLIGMKPVSSETKYSYRVRQQGSAKSYIVRAMAFLTYYNIKIKGTVLFPSPAVEDGMLVLEMSKATPLAPRKSKVDSTQQQFVLGKSS